MSKEWVNERDTRGPLDPRSRRRGPWIETNRNDNDEVFDTDDD